MKRSPIGIEQPADVASAAAGSDGSNAASGLCPTCGQVVIAPAPLSQPRSLGKHKHAAKAAKVLGRPLL